MHQVGDMVVRDWPADGLPEIRRGTCRTRQGHKSRLRDAILTLDIETTTEELPEGKASYIYHWQVCVDGVPFFGRDAETLLSFLRAVADQLDGDRILCFIENMGYEWQFLAQYIQRDLGLGESLFVQPRKPLFVRTAAGIEFRDAYRLTGKGLEALTKGFPHEKKKDDLDYRKIRRPWDPLKPAEEIYCLCDAVGLWEALIQLLADNGDNPATIPLTLTGYTRRYMKKILRGSSRYHRRLPEWRLPIPAFQVANEAARGGNTHANRYHSTDTLRKIGSADIQSAHPSQMLLEEYPIGKAEYYGQSDTREELRHIIRAGYMFFGRFRITNLHVKDRHPIPDIPLSKCLTAPRKPVLDNGRILAAEEVILSMTSVDFELLEDIYRFDRILGMDIWVSFLGPLPKVYRDAVFEKFAEKSILKYKGRSTDEEKRAYDLSKVVVNGIFGMAYMNPVRQEVVFRPDCMEYEPGPDKLPAMTEEEFEKLQRNYPWSYLWGLWTAALTRKELHQGIQAVGYDNVIYCDTDSIKFRGPFPAALAEYNRQRTEKARALGYIAKVGEKEFVPGIWEDEAEGAPYLYDEFRTLGAKKYAYTLPDGSFHITVSGVQKEAGAKALEILAKKEGISPVEAFEPGAYISDAGGFKASYDYHPIREIILPEGRIPAASCIVADPRDYTLSILSDYETLIFEAQAELAEVF